MPLATPRHYAAMLDAAADRGYAHAAVNVTSSETLNAALRGFELANADGIVQITVGAAEYLSGTGAKDALLGARALADYAHVVAEASPVLVALHTDHCPPAHVDDWLRPLLAESRRRVERNAAPLFHSHMFDGSTLPLAENLRIAAELLGVCAELDIVLEIESGVVGGEEDGIAGPDNAHPDLYTTPGTSSASPAPWVSASAAGTWSRRRSATCTEPTPQATWFSAPRSCEPASKRSRPRTPAPASSTYSTAAAGRAPKSSQMRSRLGW